MFSQISKVSNKNPKSICFLGRQRAIFAFKFVGLEHDVLAGLKKKTWQVLVHESLVCHQKVQILLIYKITPASSEVNLHILNGVSVGFKCRKKKNKQPSRKKCKFFIETQIASANQKYKSYMFNTINKLDCQPNSLKLTITIIFVFALRRY